jgi:superfamily II DNA or RNA helicase
MEIREKIQKQAVDEFVKVGKGILHISMRVGKTKIGLDILKTLPIKSALIAYPDNKIYDGWVLEMKKWGYPGNISIQFTNYASLSKYENEKYDVVVWDELQMTSERQKESAAIHMTKAKYSLGLTGTLSDDSKKEWEALGMKVLMAYSVEDAIGDGIIAPYQITIHTVKLDEIVKEKNKKGKWVTEKQRYDAYSYVIQKLRDEGKDWKFIALHRNRVLQSSVSKRNKTLELIQRFKHRKTLIFTGLKKTAESLGIAFHHSTSKDDTAFENFKHSKITQLAVVNIGRAGVTFKDLECIIISSFTGNEETTEQIIARALNKDLNNKIADIHIVCSTEEAEIKKLKKTLSNFNEECIKWI